MTFLLASVVFFALFLNFASCGDYPEYPVDFKPERGHFDAPFNLTLTSPFDSSAVSSIIRYTVSSGMDITYGKFMFEIIVKLRHENHQECKLC